MTLNRIREIYHRRGLDAAMNAARASRDPHLIDEVERLSGKQPDTTDGPEQATEFKPTPPPIRHTPIQYGMPLSVLDRLNAARKVST